MMPLQNTATFVAIKPQSVATSATATGYVDCLNCSEVAVDVILDSAASTTSNPAVLKLSHADDTNATSFSDITGFVGDATDGFVIPAVGTADATVVRLNVNMRARKRYLKVTVTPAGAAQLLAATMTLGQAKTSTANRAGQAAVVDG